jgi:hypothetical protein
MKITRFDTKIKTVKTFILISDCLSYSAHRSTQPRFLIVRTDEPLICAQSVLYLCLSNSIQYIHLQHISTEAQIILVRVLGHRWLVYWEGYVGIGESSSVHMLKM